MRVEALQEVLGVFLHLVVVDVDRDENVAAFYFAFVALRFVFRNSEADERTGDAADGDAGRRARERRHERARCDERTEARNGERADAREEADRPAENSTRRATGDCAFRCFGVELVREILRRRLVRKKNRDVVQENPSSRARKMIASASPRVSTIPMTDFFMIRSCWISW